MLPPSPVPSSHQPVPQTFGDVGEELVRFATGRDRSGSADHVALPADCAFRVAPLLHVVSATDGHLIVLGQIRVTVPSAGFPDIEVHLTAAWATGELAARLGPEASGRSHHTPWASLENWQRVDAGDEIESVVRTAVHGLRWRTDEDVEERVTRIAKDLAERSRDAVADLRNLRYELETLLSSELRKASTRTLERLLADLLELSTLASRARDEARECARGGLWAWRTDDDAYHAQRRLQDPTLAPRPEPAKPVRRTWLHLHDAAVRHCQAMERQLGDETASLRGLLNATSTMSVTRDARSSETFNLVASVGGIMLGLPALVLTLYGASSVLPLSTSNYVVLLPLAFAGLVAAVIAAYLPGRERTGKVRRFLAALGAVTVTLGLLAAAGALVHPATP
ncbi:hypothetical protein O2W18_05790 [Modestobacter sp. VKM Ac-2983]|uniref:hypothetical protein n=1 Tax=Modestobacter sp. VKM Ac-2983 TaxID=3004137 RepID=UPI0022AB50F0|nr:hypothetical protein [Modestobacter sp. VKM Ac-2983]MCZ2804605.1 hypothetical protein [Modestobacter sp. VKM Ac-2983]